MRNLDAADMLNVWEQGLNRSMLQKALILLAAAFPEMRPDTLAELSIGSRDACLLLLRERLFRFSAGSIMRYARNAASGLNGNRRLPISLSARLIFPQRISLCWNRTAMVSLSDCPTVLTWPRLKAWTMLRAALTRLLRRCILSVDYNDASCEN